ncbi:hypothetical protein [Alteripontixanthobacter muriae]|uniref:hypothetical protein n=1 Tax=Alteripontixanthobacter muriae TaxID=2705546 RepID=UPI001574FB95|nr:hypothetical protein [Alteripontixanthobacter muriae]
MKKIALVALTAAFALTACDGPREEAGEDIDDINNADGVLTEGPAEEMGEVMDERADELGDDAMMADDTMMADDAVVADDTVVVE